MDGSLGKIEGLYIQMRYYKRFLETNSCKLLEDTDLDRGSVTVT